MAEAINLGASIITFVAVAARLTSVAKDAWDSVGDAPEEIARVIHKLGSLEFLLSEIHSRDISTANNQAANRLTNLWTSQSNQLKRDFSTYQELADKLALRLKKDRGPISSARTKFQWFLKQETVRELERRLQENIRTFDAILGYLTYDTVRSASFDLQELRSVGAQSAESIKKLAPIIEKAVASASSEISQTLQRAFPFEPQVSKASTARNPAGSTVSIRFEHWYTYALPFGTLRVTRGVKKLGWNKSWRYGPTCGSTDEETTSGIMFDFSPAPWLMTKAIIGTFVLHHRKYCDLPGLTHMISTENVLPSGHQALIAVQHGQVSKMEGLFKKGLATPNDRGTCGRSLLHIAAAKQDHEMCALLIREGADCNAVDDHGRTPMHDLRNTKQNEKDEKDQTVALLDIHADSENDPTIPNRHGISAFTYHLVNGLDAILYDDHSRLPDDFDKLLELLDNFEEIDELDPIPLTLSLCAVHSGGKVVAAKVEPAVKQWLENYHKGESINLEDATALRALTLQDLQRRAPELATNQAELVLRFAFTVGCSVDVIRALVRPGTVNGDGGRGDEGGDPLLTLAAERGDLEVVNILLDAGADDQADDLSAFRYALSEKHDHVVQRFLDRGISSIMALNIAIEHGTLDLVKYFIERVPDLSARLGGKNSNRTVLFTAAATGDVEKIKLLVESGINVLARDTNGWTAFAICWRMDLRDATEYLEREEDRLRLKNKLKGIPEDPEFDSLAVLATAASKSDPPQKLPSPVGEIDPDFGITEEVYQSKPVYHVLDSWGSLKVLTTGDMVLIASGLCVTLVGAFYVVVANAVRSFWQNRRYMTARNAKRVGWLVGLMLSLAFWIGYSAGKKR